MLRRSFLGLVSLLPLVGLSARRRLTVVNAPKTACPTIIDVPIEKLRYSTWRRSPNLCTENFKRLKLDICRRGLQQPLMIDKEYNILSGVMRFHACRMIGLKTIPCVFKD